MSNEEMLVALSGAIPLGALVGMAVYLRLKRPGPLGMLLAGGLSTAAVVLSLVGMHLAGKLFSYLPLVAYFVAVYLVSAATIMFGVLRRKRQGVSQDA